MSSKKPILRKKLLINIVAAIGADAHEMNIDLHPHWTGARPLTPAGFIKEIRPYLQRTRERLDAIQGIVEDWNRDVEVWEQNGIKVTGRFPKR